jgi:RNA polymerase sigma factor (sigma-70 family)
MSRSERITAGLEPAATKQEQGSSLTPEQQALVTQNMDYAAALAYKATGSLDEDVRQAAFLGLTQAASKFKPEGVAQFTTFSFRRIKGEAIDELKRREYPLLPPEEDQIDPDGLDEDAIIADLDQPALIERVHMELEQIESTQSEVIKRHFLGGVAIGDIAREQGVTFQAVNQRKQAALAKLAAALA